MESVGQTMSHMNRARQFNYEDLVAQILADQEVAAFIKDQSLSEQEIRRSISKFNQYISERNRFLLGDSDYIAKGYKPILTMNEGYEDVAYEETPEIIEAQKRAAIKAAATRNKKSRTTLGAPLKPFFFLCFSGPPLSAPPAERGFRPPELIV